MISYRDVSIVIPARNEEATIGEVLARISQVSGDFEVIVCSDGSTDATAERAREMKGTLVIEHPYSLGNGAAVKSGALKASRPYVVFLDADLQHPPEDIPLLLAHLPAYDMVVGARTRACKTSMHRSLGNAVLTWVARRIARHPIEDLTSGFRAVKKDIFLKFAHLYPLGYSYPSTSTLAFLCSGYFVKYVPLPNITARTSGASAIRPLPDGFVFLHIILRIIMTFSPHKLFYPISFFFFVLGVFFSAMQLLAGGAIRSTGIILLISSLVVFLNGILADQLARLRKDLNR